MNTDIITALSNAIDEDGLKLNISLSSQTYLYLALTGIIIFAAGGVVWNLLAKTIK